MVVITKKVVKPNFIIKLCPKNETCNISNEIIKKYSSPGTKIFIADLYRPDSQEDAQRIVNDNAASEPEILQRDFYNSLLAAFELTEIKEQLVDADLNELKVKTI